MSIIILIIILVLLAIWVISTYNSLVRQRMNTKESFSQIDVQLKRRNDLIPNLINTVKGYAKFEQETLTKVIQLRNQVQAAQTPSDKMDASNQLSTQLNGIFAVAESYPDLKANTSFMQLQEELTNTENKIGYSRQLYNTTISNYNTKIQSFPANIIAGIFHFEPGEFLETPEEEKAVPKVEF